MDRKRRSILLISIDSHRSQWLRCFGRLRSWVIRSLGSLVGIHCRYTLCSRPYVFAAGVQCITSVFAVEPRRMLSIIQRFGKNCSCHLQGECCSLPNSPNWYTFTLKMVTAMFVQTLDNTKNSTRLNPESRSCGFYVVLSCVGEAPRWTDAPSEV
jgi:hypothetical protein